MVARPQATPISRMYDLRKQSGFGRMRAGNLERKLDFVQESFAQSPKQCFAWEADLSTVKVA